MMGRLGKISGSVVLTSTFHQFKTTSKRSGAFSAGGLLHLLDGGTLEVELTAYESEVQTG
jgi:hypothetical protein